MDIKVNKKDKKTPIWLYNDKKDVLHLSVEEAQLLADELVELECLINPLILARKKFKLGQMVRLKIIKDDDPDIPNKCIGKVGVIKKHLEPESDEFLYSVKMKNHDNEISLFESELDKV